MGEGIPNILNPNLIKSAAAAVAIGSAVVPVAIDESAVPKVASVDRVKQTQIDQAAESDSEIQVISTGKSVLDTRHSHATRHKRPRVRFTGYEVEGQTSTFGWPTDGYNSKTADGGNTVRACIAIRNDTTLDHEFQVTVLYHHARLQAYMPQCDWGPAAWTGRAIDITGKGVLRLHLNPWNYPTGALGIARELKKQT